MPTSFDVAVAALEPVCHRFDDAAHVAKAAALAHGTAQPLRAGPALLRWHELLLFLLAHPSDAAMHRAVVRELNRLAAFVRKLPSARLAALDGHGLPWASTTTRFSHDCLRWLLARPDLRVTPSGWEAPQLDLNAVLRLTLPALERNETTASLANDALLDVLRVPAARRLPFLIDELARLDGQPYVKDTLFEALGLYVCVTPTRRSLSKAGNRLPLARPLFAQRELLRRFDARALMDTPLPAPRPLDAAARTQVLDVVKLTMMLTARETDPATHADPRALQVYDLERGLAVALFGMVPARQLPLESYVGFTLFKNGLPVAYGGAWVLGERAAFGMNVFEPYRGGESGYLMCQLLRTYRQAFGVRWFEVDAHQFGLDNPDGIASGAYWFYHRYGFRSLDARLAALAAREHQLNTARPGRRSSRATLIKLTGSDVALNFGGPRPPHLYDLTTRVTPWVQRAHGGCRAAAEADALARFGYKGRVNADEARVLTDVALLAAALPVADAPRRHLLAQMVRAKPRDLMAYQRLLTRFLTCAPF
ncbi:MAG: hypothetical protein LCH73_07855 [Proteobacteria bacterium]|nr:hypothetical protein [Pseudomonadota bacterium]